MDGLIEIDEIYLFMQNEHFATLPTYSTVSLDLVFALVYADADGGCP